MEDLLQVGVITSPHGIRGEVKVFPTTEDAKRFLELKTVLLDTGREKRQLTIEGVKFFKKLVILKFREFHSMNEVEGLRQRPLLVKREDAIPLEEGEYFVADLVGMEVLLEDGSLLGELIDVIETGANDVYVVKKEAGEILIPAISSCIKEISPEKNQMKVHLLKGL